MKLTRNHDVKKVDRDKLVRALLKRNWTHRDLAAAAQIHVDTVRRSYRHGVPLYTLMKIADALNTPATDLLAEGEI